MQVPNFLGPIFLKDQISRSPKTSGAQMTLRTISVKAKKFNPCWKVLGWNVYLMLKRSRSKSRKLKSLGSKILWFKCLGLKFLGLKCLGLMSWAERRLGLKSLGLKCVATFKSQFMLQMAPSILRACVLPYGNLSFLPLFMITFSSAVMSVI
jgi:hypothetical protein